MYSPYYNDIQTIRSLNQRCPIAKKLYAALLSKDSSDNQPPTNQNKLSLSDIDEFKNRLYESLSTIPYIPQDYFNNYYDRLFYEIIFWSLFFNEAKDIISQSFGNSSANIFAVVRQLPVAEK